MGNRWRATIKMKSELFLDTAYAIALSVPRDAFHERALQLADRLEAERAHLVTTRAVMLEIGNALSKQRYRSAAVKLLQALESDPLVEIVALSEQLYYRALRLYSTRADKEWGLSDCVSFVVMQERKITEALTTDDHFRQAGFQALLLEDA
jgi:predicted nucleic acid-binding protein